MIIEKGRPSDFSARSRNEQKVYEKLDALGIGYIRADHDAAATMEDCLAVEEGLEVKICKNLFLRNRQGTAFYLLLMPGEKPFKTKELSSQLSCSRLSFAEVEDMEHYLDVTPGSVSVLGLMNDKENQVRLLIDQDLLTSDSIGCHPCRNTSTLKLLLSDLIEIFLPAVHHPFETVTLKGE